jgi:hypothetical protein
MVVDLNGFAQWTGAIPFTELRKRSTTNGARFEDRRNVLHFWGNLGGAGERFVECDDEAQALERLRGLLVMAKENCPRAVITEEDSVTHIHDPASGGDLRAELEPKSEYDASWQTNMDKDGWLHRFGDDAQAFFWFVGDSLVHVGSSQSGEELIFLKHTVSQARDRAVAKAYVAKQPAGQAVAVLSITNPRSVAIWAPLAPDDLQGFDVGVEASRTAPTKLATEEQIGVGTALSIQPGCYAASLGSVEASKVEKRGWSASWCRLTRLG